MKRKRKATRERRTAFTPERIRELLEKSAKGAQELRDTLQAEHLRGLQNLSKLVLR